jgi:hypothetical protein
MRHFIYNFILMSLLLMLASCGSNSPNGIRKDAIAFCKELNGSVIKLTEDSTTIEVCRYEEEAQFDDGITSFIHHCELIAFYEGRCDEAGEADYKNKLSENQADQLGLKSDKNGRQQLYNRVRDILYHLDNTGYSHNRNNNFSLQPDPSEFPLPTTGTDPYNLFLDCSGFVGYYVLQDIAPNLYQNIPLLHSCGSRPLAADFADLIENMPTDFEDATQEDIESGNVCFGKVDDIKNAKRGDILVYRHSDNISEESDTCKNGRVVHRAECVTDECSARKNTGHILFIMNEPYESKHCKDSNILLPFFPDPHPGCYNIPNFPGPGHFQWVVKVADSTTSRHSKDGRHVGAGESYFDLKDKGNAYHAWTKFYTSDHKGYDVKRCNDGSFHRFCEKYGDVAEGIYINTSHRTHPTGVGVGYMYVNDEMDGFRTKYGSKIEHADVFIGRLAKCNPLH